MIREFSLPKLKFSKSAGPTLLPGLSADSLTKLDPKLIMFFMDALIESNSSPPEFSDSLVHIKRLASSMMPTLVASSELHK